MGKKRVKRNRPRTASRGRADPRVAEIRAYIENRLITCALSPERDQILREAIGLLSRIPTDILIAFLPVFGKYAEPQRGSANAEDLGLRVRMPAVRRRKAPKASQPESVP